MQFWGSLTNANIVFPGYVMELTELSSVQLGILSYLTHTINNNILAVVLIPLPTTFMAFLTTKVEEWSSAPEQKQLWNILSL